MNADLPLRVCLVSAAYRPYPSGVSEHVHHLALELHRLGVDASILTTSHGRAATERGPVPVTRFGRAVLVPMNRSFATVPVGLRLAAQVKRYLADRDFDIVHCHGMFYPEIAHWAIRYSRAVNVVTSLTAGFRITTTGSTLFQRLFRGQLRRIHGRIAISNRALAAVRAYVPGEFRIIPSGVDVERFRPGLDRPALYERDRPVILSLGRLDRRKGLDTLLCAMPAVLSRIPDAMLVVIGAGPLEASARRLSVELGIERAVRFAGIVSQTELPRYYAGCNVYCSPASGGETLGIVLLEAMACGVPVVASNIPGYDETVRNGADGILVPPRAPEPLAAALVSVLTEPPLAERLARAGLERAKEFAWTRIARRTLEFYKELLALKRPG